MRVHYLHQPRRPSRRGAFIAAFATLALHVGILGLAAVLTPAAPKTRVAEVLIGHVDEASGDFQAAGYAKARVRAR